jgi:hypothetical protein
MERSRLPTEFYVFVVPESNRDHQPVHDPMAERDRLRDCAIITCTDGPAEVCVRKA